MANPAAKDVAALITDDLIATLRWTSEQADDFVGRRFVGVESIGG